MCLGGGPLGSKWSKLYLLGFWVANEHTKITALKNIVSRGNVGIKNIIRCGSVQLILFIHILEAHTFVHVTSITGCSSEHNLDNYMFSIIAQLIAQCGVAGHVYYNCMSFKLIFA